MSLITLIGPSNWAARYARCRPTLRYLAETEAHVYALAVAASVLLSFYPFLIVILTFCRDVLNWPAAVNAIYMALNDFLPGELGGFIQRNIKIRGTFQLTSMLLLLFTANGVFEPLEVALNRAWGVTSNRSYLRNQLVSLGMIFMCGGLALLSLILTAMHQSWTVGWTGPMVMMRSWVDLVLFKLAAVPISILALFLVYWLLPNRKVDPRQAAPVAIVVGLLLEALKYVNLLIWPLFGTKLQREYGVFYNSVTILLWSFIGAMVILAGAEWAARAERDRTDVS
ncbi:MAG TPA: YihY/virulence factor BrkB family protein [Bryobacteraceae bacterium]|nr:YihY/virulence factor BrkB family protein [Bryobacteraceae bacterium]